jgi:hypothetical protein
MVDFDGVEMIGIYKCRKPEDSSRPLLAYCTFGLNKINACIPFLGYGISIFCDGLVGHDVQPSLVVLKNYLC